MTEQFVVLLRGADRAEEFLPYIEAIARPGIKIVFLVHYGLAEFPELMNHVLAGRSTTLPNESAQANESKPRLGRYDPRAELLHSFVTLRRRGVELSVSVYSGGARKAARQYVRDNAANVLMLSRGEACALVRWVRRRGWLSHFFKSSRPPSVLMMHR